MEKRIQKEPVSNNKHSKTKMNYYKDRSKTNFSSNKVQPKDNAE